MIDILKLHLSGLARFSGRESRAQFWPWVAIVMVSNMALSLAIFLPGFFAMFDKVNRFAAEHPDQVTVTRGPGSYSVQVHGNHPELMPDFSAMIGGMSVAVAIAVILLAAAVARRLRDCNRSALWGLLPLPFLVSGMVLMPGLFDQIKNSAEPDMGRFFALFINNMVYLASLAVLVIMLAQPGKPDPSAN